VFQSRQRMQRSVRVPTARVTRDDDSGAKSATGRVTRPVVLGFPQVEHPFKTAHQAGFWISLHTVDVGYARAQAVTHQLDPRKLK
jgi:hypothetical protein